MDAVSKLARDTGRVVGKVTVLWAAIEGRRSHKPVDASDPEQVLYKRPRPPLGTTPHHRPVGPSVAWNHRTGPGRRSQMLVFSPSSTSTQLSTAWR